MYSHRTNSKDELVQPNCILIIVINLNCIQSEYDFLRHVYLVITNVATNLYCETLTFSDNHIFLVTNLKTQALD